MIYSDIQHYFFLF